MDNRDKIFILQIGSRQWTEIPNGTEFDDGGLYITDPDELDDWIKPFIQNDYIDHNDDFWKAAESEVANNGWPLVAIIWDSHASFLTQQEAELYAKQRKYRWDAYRIVGVHCEGELSKILENHQASPQPESYQ